MAGNKKSKSNVIAKEIKVSVVVPTYNRKKFLNVAITSIIAAIKKANLCKMSEIIVVDDGWNMAIEDMDIELDVDNIILIKSKLGPGGGPAGARNDGVEAARGKYIYFLDDDDYFFENRFFSSLELLRSGKYDCVFENSIRESDDGSKPRICGPSQSKHYDNAFYYLLESSPIWPCATSFTKNVYHMVGGMDEFLRGDGEDGEFLLKLSLKGRVNLDRGDPVGYVRRHGNNISGKRKFYVPLKALSRLARNVNFNEYPEEKTYLKKFIQAKLDYSLTMCRQEYPYLHRIGAGAKVMRYYKWRYLTWRNIKTIAVFLGLTGK